MGPKEQIIYQKLTQGLSPTFIELRNDSQKHKGHAGYDAESHFHLVIASDQFLGKSRMICHRLIHEILSEELNQRNPEAIHSLTIELKL